MTWRPPRHVAVALALVPLLGVACGGDDNGDGDAAPAGDGEVKVIDNKFEPETIEIAVGDTVTWSFEGAVPHNVKGDGFESKTMKDGTYEHTFNSADTYKYVCTIHPGMNGKVIVE